MSQESDFSDKSNVTIGGTCEGCLYQAPGQRHHMNPGGCLYSDDSNCDKNDN